MYPNIMCYGAARKNNKNKDLARNVVGLVTPAFDIKTVNKLNKWFKALCTVILFPTIITVYTNESITIQLNNNCKTAINPDSTSQENFLKKINMLNALCTKYMI